MVWCATTTTSSSWAGTRASQTSRADAPARRRERRGATASRPGALDTLLECGEIMSTRAAPVPLKPDPAGRFGSALTKGLAPEKVRARSDPRARLAFLDLTRKRSIDYAAAMTPYGTLLERVEGLCGVLPASERPLAERVLDICRALDRRPRQAGRLAAEP